MSLKIIFQYGFKVFYFLILVILYFNTLSCQNKTSNTNDNPENIIAKEINNKKIVILGEQPHRHPAGYNEVIKILYEWLGECKRNENKSITLNLVTEYHESWVNCINSFLNSGETTPLIDSTMAMLSFEELEFYIKLKIFNDSIKSINNNNPGFAIKFKVLGFEEPAINFTPEFSKKTIYEAQYWFIKERDSLIVQKFINFYNNNKSDKYLFYYGLGHLQKNYVSKRLEGFKVGQDSCYGYFLAGYLKREFGENDVLTILKIMGSESELKKMGMDSLANKKLLTKSENIRYNPEHFIQYDYVFFNPYTDIVDHSFDLVFSKKVFEKALEKLIILERNLPETWVYDFGKKILKKLSYLTGKDHKDAKELKNWFESQKSFDLSYFDSKEYRDNVYKIYANDEDDVKAKNLLRQFGFEKDIEEYNSMDTAEWNNKIWPDALKNIKIINAIGVYWAGYPDEKIKAKEFLKNISSEDYAEPEKYLQWWRNVYHNYGI